jgi:hypothetical protein
MQTLRYVCLYYGTGCSAGRAEGSVSVGACPTLVASIVYSAELLASVP